MSSAFCVSLCSNTVEIASAHKYSCLACIIAPLVLPIYILETATRKPLIPPGGKRLCDDVYQLIQGVRSFGRGPHSLSSIAFFSKIKPNEEKVVYYFLAYFDLVLHSRLTKQSLRSDVDRSTDQRIHNRHTDRSTDRQIDGSTDRRIDKSTDRRIDRQDDYYTVILLLYFSH